MMITVFTPTYNRAYILPKLYESLCKQTCSDFEWVVVDDGSKDDTKQLFDTWIPQSDFKITYIQQPNGGKHRAINKGVTHAAGELLFIVDSDDQLATTAIERILNHYEGIKGNSRFGGLSGLRAYHTGEIIGNTPNFGVLDCSYLDVRYKHRIKGDMAEVYLTKVLKEIPFPEIPGERFCPEALVWDRIALKYDLRYFSEPIYLCDYLPDGLTAAITRVRMQSPVASCYTYLELAKSPIPFFYKVRASINYWRFYFCESENKKPRISALWYITKPLGYIMHWRDRKNQKA
ncbi:MAG: glycosyltransferase family 2 protein [Bacteroidaceae bacterium]|nr:glycosyltransferase family 2 protein [Bacteroidaceae bacterium]